MLNVDNEIVLSSESMQTVVMINASMETPYPNAKYET